MATTINASTSAGLVSTADTSGVLQLQTAGTTALSISATQATTLAGSLTFSAADAGITFNKTGALVNSTLNDYETGSWTPSLGGTTTYSGQVGTYTKIGNLVIASFAITVNVIGTGSTSQISGLPFTASGSSTLTGSIGYWTGFSSSTTGVFIRVDGGSAVIKVSGTTVAATGVTNPYAIFQNGTVFIGNVVYYA